MADYTFTGPDGKAYSISGPEGSTREEAFKHLPAKYPELRGQPGFEETPAATEDVSSRQNEVPAPGKFDQPPENPIAEKHGVGAALTNVVANTGIGGAIGALAPELTMGAGAIVSMIPGGQVAGPLIVGAGEAMRLTRTAGILAGAVSGALGSVAEEATRASGKASETGVLAAGMVGGMLTPEISIVKNFVSKPLKAAWAVMENVVSGSTKEARNLGAGSKILKGMFDGKVPEHDLHMILKQGAAADQEAAGKAAAQVMQEAYAKAQKLAQTDQKAADAAIAEGKAQAAKIQKEAGARAAKLQVITKGRLAGAEAVSKLLADARKAVGTDRPVSDIGNALRQKTSEVQGKAIAERQAAYVEQRKARDAVVASKEQAGQFLDAMPETKALMQEIDKKILTSRAGREASKVTLPNGKQQGVASVTEGGVEKAYSNIREAVKNKRVPVSVDPETGATKYETFKTSFEAIDHLRRKLGDAAFKGEKEGYGALGQSIAKDYYYKLAHIQEQYAGESQKVLQSTYARQTGDVAKFETATGRKMLAVDRIDPEVFSKDPAAIPGAYFKTQQGVQDLKELTGDPVLVQRAAEDYASGQVAGKSGKQVKEWVAGQKDWLREVPGLEKKLLGYADRVGKIESAQQALTASAQRAKAAHGKVLAETPAKVEGALAQGTKTAGERVGSRVEEQAAIREAGAAKAGEITKSAQAWTQKLSGSGFAVQDVRGLLKTGSRDDVVRAMKYAAGTPGAKENVEGAVRQVLATTSPNGLREMWDGRLRVALQEAQVISPKALAKLDADVAAAFAKNEPATIRPRLQKYLNAAMVSGGRGLVGSDTKVPEQSKEPLPWQR